MTDKTTSALKLAEAYIAGMKWSEEADEALAAIREARAEQPLLEPEGRCKECMAYNDHLDYCSKAKPVKQEPVAEAHSGNLRWLIPDEEQPANAKLFLHPSESRFKATYENGAPMFSKTIVKENGDPIMLNKDGTRSIFCDVDDDCKTAPVQPVKQEPVAWMWKMHGWVVTAHGKYQAIKSYVDVCQPPLETQASDDFIELVPLYAAPVSAKREWVDLTPTELAEAFSDKGSADAGIRAVIAAFKEKNSV